MIVLLLLIFLGIPAFLTILNAVRLFFPNTRIPNRFGVVCDVYSTIGASIYLILFVTLMYDADPFSISVCILTAIGAAVFMFEYFVIALPARKQLYCACAFQLATAILALSGICNFTFNHTVEITLKTLPFINYLMVSARLLQNDTAKKEEILMTKRAKISFLLYILFTAVSFFIFVTPVDSRLGYLLFFLLQAAAVYPLMPKKRAMLWFIPIVLLAASCFISDNRLLFIPNVPIIVLCLSISALHAAGAVSFKNSSFISDTLFGVFEPLGHISEPFIWLNSLNKNADTALRKRVLLGIVIALPSVIVLLAILSSADAVFGEGVHSFIELLPELDFTLITKILLSLAVGLYLFCVVYNSHSAVLSEKSAPPRLDALVFNIVLISLAVVYTLFIFVQFRYLFAGRVPDGMSYSSYARKGFFELVFLSIVNILLIMLSVSLTNGKSRINTICCLYLCAVTVVLGVSAFYRMQLYSDSDGLTRLRYSVFVFLCFEGIGLLFTFWYIVKRSINIAGIYALLTLCFYLVLNVVPMDYIIAKNQVDRYISGRGNGIEYVFTLSRDADTQLLRLKDDEAFAGNLDNRFSIYPINADKLVSKNISHMISDHAYERVYKK